MPSSGTKRAARRQTIPLRKSDTEHLFDYFLYQQKLKTLPSEHDVTTGVQHVLESTTITTTGTKGLTVTQEEQNQQQQLFKRTHSYRKATHRQSICTELDDHLNNSPSPFQMKKETSFKKENYDKRKYKTLPLESGTLRASQRKRKSTEEQVINNNNNNNNTSSQYQHQRSGSVASSGSDDDDGISVSTIDRKKKSAFQRAKERILHTFIKQKKSDEDKKKKSKDKKSPKSQKKKTKKGSSKAGNVVVMDEYGHSVSHVSQTRQGDILVRKEESMETKDSVTPSGPPVHSESHTIVTDTRDLSTKSKPTPIARLHSLRRSVRRRFSDASKSPKEENKSGQSTSGQSIRLSRHASISSPTTANPVGQFRQPDSTVTRVFEAIISQDGEAGVPKVRRLRSGSRGKERNKGDRSKLQLPGLVSCHAHLDALESSEQFEADIETNTCKRCVRSPDGHMEVSTCTCESVHVCPMDVDDVEADGPDDLDVVDGAGPGTPGHAVKKGRGSRKKLIFGGEDDAVPFDQLSEKEKARRIESVANRLAVIADNYVTRVESSQSDTECQSPTGSRAARHPPERLNSLERDLVLELRREGDRLSQTVNVPAVIMPIAMQLVRQTDQYHHFRNVVDTSLGSTIDWHNVAMYFYVTRAAVQMAGTGGAVALKLKDMALKYFSDKFAGWITDRGGWDSVLEETDSELD